MKSYHKAVYKPDSQSTNEWIIIVGDVAAAEKWKGGDRYASLLLPFPTSSIPLVSIVDSFDVFHTGQGSQGLLQRPSKQELETVFGTTKEDEIVEVVLTKGTIKSSDAPHQWTSVNDQRSGNYQVSAGSGGKSGHGGR
ncbi:SBDS family protein [Rhodotorula paludigena]|uniref:SBDS family protein n=1 Tax=Rhodotorula paludigena TaxID=86838 RepID=UPI003179F15D